MRIVSHGVDIVRVSRIQKIWAEHGDVFLNRVYTPAERVYCLDCRTPAVRLSGRFAVKEAVLKALGTGWRGGLEFRHVETLADPLGKPVVTLSAKTAEFARGLGISSLLTSISHADEYAIASVIAVGH